MAPNTPFSGGGCQYQPDKKNARTNSPSNSGLYNSSSMHNCIKMNRKGTSLSTPSVPLTPVFSGAWMCPLLTCSILSCFQVGKGIGLQVNLRSVRKLGHTIRCSLYHITEQLPILSLIRGNQPVYHCVVSELAVMRLCSSCQSVRPAGWCVGWACEG